MVTHSETRTFDISKFKNLLEKPRNLSEVTRVCENHQYDAITVSNLVWYWSISTQISNSWSKLAKWVTLNLFQRMFQTIEYIWLFLQHQISKAQKWINHDEYCYHVKQFILSSANSYCNFHILFICYVL